MSTATPPDIRSGASTGLAEPSTIPPAQERDRRRPILLGLLVLAGAAGAVFGLPRWRFSQTHESTDNAQLDGHIVPVVARVAGFVSSVRVEENQRVRKGDTLVVLDAAEARARLAQADADLEGARAVSGDRGRPGQSETVVRSATNQRASLEAQVAVARANLRKAKADEGRMQDLIAKQIVSRQQVDAAQLAVQSATANLETAERQFAGATAGVDNAQLGKRLALARLASSQAVRDNAALQLTYTVITAPRDGFVSRKQVDAGQLVQAGQPVLTIVDDQDMWVAANFKETQLATLRIGQTAVIDVDAYDDCRGEGAIASMSAATGAKFALIPPDNATGNFTKVVQRVPVRLTITKGCGDDLALRPGMSVSVHVLTR